MDIKPIRQKDIEFIEQSKGDSNPKKIVALTLKNIKYRATGINEGLMCFCTRNERRIYYKDFYEWYDRHKQLLQG